MSQTLMLLLFLRQQLHFWQLDSHKAYRWWGFGEALQVRQILRKVFYALLAADFLFGLYQDILGEFRCGDKYGYVNVSLSAKGAKWLERSNIN